MTSSRNKIGDLAMPSPRSGTTFCRSRAETPVQVDRGTANKFRDAMKRNNPN